MMHGTVPVRFIKALLGDWLFIDFLLVTAPQECYRVQPAVTMALTPVHARFAAYCNYVTKRFILSFWRWRFTIAVR